MNTRALILAAIFVGCGLPTYGAEVVWRDTNPLPAGANSAAHPLPRDDWYIRVQDNFNKTQGKQYDLIFDGDSITDMWQSRGRGVWQKFFAGYNAVDFGIGGDRTDSVLWRLSKGQVDGMHPKLIVLLIGTNNLGKNSTAQIAEGISVVVDDYLRRCPEAHVLLLALFPRGQTPADVNRPRVEEINRHLAALAPNPRVTYLDIGNRFLSPDGTIRADIMPDYLHPSERGFEIWAEAILPIIEKWVGKPKH